MSQYDNGQDNVGVQHMLKFPFPVGDIYMPWLRSSMTMSSLGSDGGGALSVEYHAGVFCGRLGAGSGI